MDGRNKYEKELDSEFEFIYRHKRKTAPENAEAKPKDPSAGGEQNNVAKNTAAQKGTKRPVAVNSAKGPKTATNAAGGKKQAGAQKAGGEKKPVSQKKPAAAKSSPAGSKIHPKYGAPYKNDTPRQRKKPLSEREKYKREVSEEENRKRLETRAEQRRKLAQGAKTGFAVISGGVVLGCLLFLISFGAFLISLNFDIAPTEDKLLEYCIGTQSQAKTVDMANYCKNGEYYVSMADIAALCNFTVAGTEQEIKYISPDTGNETVVFHVGTLTAYVNKTEIRLSAPTYRKGGVLYIPFSFLQDYSEGLICTFEEADEDENAKLTVRKYLENERDVATLGAAPIYAPVAFRIKYPAVLQGLSEDALKQDIPEPEYAIDIDPYRQYINPENALQFIGIINKDHPADGTQAYTDLCQVVSQTVTVDEPIKIREYAAKALEAMILEAKACGVTRYAVFRGYETTETSPFDDPLLDENLLGLSVDLYFGKKELSYGESEVFFWFRDNAHRFGYIVRYPDGKQDSTGVEFRPWTLRYVGRYNATKMHTENLSLEEYIEKYRLESFIGIGE